MVKIGEETGELGYILKNLSRFYKREVDQSVDNMVALIEPVMILALGAGVGVLLASVMMPLYNISTGIE
jgi:type IV pilus assembly protein PilC